MQTMCYHTIIAAQNFSWNLVAEIMVNFATLCFLHLPSLVSTINFFTVTLSRTITPVLPWWDQLCALITFCTKTVQTASSMGPDVSWSCCTACKEAGRMNCSFEYKPSSFQYSRGRRGVLMVHHKCPLIATPLAILQAHLKLFFGYSRRNFEKRYNWTFLCYLKPCIHICFNCVQKRVREGQGDARLWISTQASWLCL